MKDRKGRILITGASGFLGSHLVRRLGKEFAVTGTYYRHPKGLPPCDPLHLDISEPAMVQESLKDLDIDLCIHTAAITNPDQCDKNRDAAYQTNVEGTRNLVDAVQKKGIPFYTISTDLIFDGTKGNYGETDRTSPCNYYAETKLLAEKVVQEESDHWIILRTALMYGWGNGISHSFIDWMDGHLRTGKEVGLFTDQYRSFLYVDDVALGVKTLFENKAKNQVFHIGGPERMNRYDFGKAFVRLFGYSPDLLRPISMADLQGYAQRGGDCSFHGAKLNALGFKSKTVIEGLQAMKAEKGNEDK